MMSLKSGRRCGAGRTVKSRDGGKDTRVGVAQERRGLEGGGGVDGFYCDPREGVRGFPAARPNPPLPLRPQSSPSPLTPAGGLRPDNQTQTGTHWRAGQSGVAEHYNQMSKSESIVNRHVGQQSTTRTRGRRPDPAPSMIPSPVQGKMGLASSCGRDAVGRSITSPFPMHSEFERSGSRRSAVSPPLCLTERRLGTLAIVDSIPPNIERAVTGSVPFWQGQFSALALLKPGMAPW